MKQLRWQILVVLVTLAIAAVLLFNQQIQDTSVGGPIVSQPEQGGVYTEALVGSLGRLNPLLDWNNSADRDVNRLIFSGLVRFDEHGIPRADLAEAWGVAPDGTVYNFTIRANAAWHDGTPVTSDDVLFTIDRMKSAGSLVPQDIKDLWGRIEVTKLNEKNLKFTLPEPFVPFMDYLTFGVLPKHLLETVPVEQLPDAQFNIQPVGTGPYKFDHLIVEDNQITGVVLTINEKYYDAAPYIEQVVFRYYETSADALDAYNQGDAGGEPSFRRCVTRRVRRTEPCGVHQPTAADEFRAFQPQQPRGGIFTGCKSAARVDAGVESLFHRQQVSTGTGDHRPQPDPAEFVGIF